MRLNFVILHTRCPHATLSLGSSVNESTAFSVVIVPLILGAEFEFMDESADPNSVLLCGARQLIPIRLLNLSPLVRSLTLSGEIRDYIHLYSKVNFSNSIL